MEKACENCGKTFEVPTMGRPKRFCHARCRVMASRKARSVPVPQVLAALDRWVCWKPIRRHGRWTKMPIQADGMAASSTDSSTWANYRTVRRASDRVGFVLGEKIDGKYLVCVDLDHCFTGDGSLTSGAKTFLGVCDPTWIEISPSGDGLHVWGLIESRPSRCVFSWRGQSFEVYIEGRYLTVTGKRWKDSPLVLADLEPSMEVLFASI